MNYFVDEKSIVRNIWKNTDCVLLIFAGSAAEFALNKAVDWLYYTGKIPNNPLERLFSTVEFAQQIVFAENDKALATIDSITKIHESVEKSRGQKIPDWAYRDVLYMLIDYSIRSYELLERKLETSEKEEIFDVFNRLGVRMGLKNLPKNLNEWIVDRNHHLENDLQKGKFTTHLFEQYKVHLGKTRYFILLQIQHILVPKTVYKQLFKFSFFPWLSILQLYKMSRVIKLDRLIKSLILPKKYKEELSNIGKFKKKTNSSITLLMKDLIIEKMYELSKKPYQLLFKRNKAWEVTISDLIVLPQDTLGFHLSCFLLKYNFEIQPKLEDHDIIHVLTNTGVSVVEEIGMQYYLLGNGKKSIYLFLVILSGSLFYPSKFDFFIKQFQRGLDAHCFYDLEFKKMLTIPVTDIRETFNI